MNERPGFVPPMLRAEGNLSYLDFIRLVKKLWNDSHPDIPIYATGTEKFPTYPCIVYGLELRKTMNNEPKPKYREQLLDDGKVYLILVQSRS